MVAAGIVAAAALTGVFLFWPSGSEGATTGTPSSSPTAAASLGASEGVSDREWAYLWAWDTYDKWSVDDQKQACQMYADRGSTMARAFARQMDIVIDIDEATQGVTDLLEERC